MGKLTIANLKKTIYYLQRNGFRNTWNAAWERLSDTEKYQVQMLSPQQCEDLKKQAEAEIRNLQAEGKEAPFFSILVPAYQTDPAFLRELVQSMRDQVYPLWELLILDASEDGMVRKTLRDACMELDLVLYNGTEGMEGMQGTEGLSFPNGTPMATMELIAGVKNPDSYESVVRYVSLSRNEGISENTNAGCAFAKGSYIGLLDHDDVLTPDALYEMAKAVWSASPMVLYSDEDKWDGETQYYERNRKEDFNLDLLLSNNYICHFMVLEEALFRELKLRKAYDGAQDYDLILRAAAKIMARGGIPEVEICHIPKVLYHWRCHSASTAENPRSKTYAYEAGQRALQDFAKGQGWQVAVKNLKHVGFYRMEFQAEKAQGDPTAVLSQRADVGAVGGKLVSGGVLAGGRMAEDGSVYYEGLKEGYSGYLHRAVLTQDAEAVDLRCIAVQKEFWPLFEDVAGVPYKTKEQSEASADASLIFDAGTLPKDADVKALSVKFCNALQEQGKRILWDPEWVKHI